MNEHQAQMIDWIFF